MSKKILKIKRDIDKNKEIKDIIEIFRHYHSSEAFEKYVLVHGKGTLMRYKKGEIISSILEEKWSRQKYSTCKRLAAAIFHELGGRHYEEGTHFYVPKIYNDFREYMYTGNLFANFQIPWKEWEDLAKEKIDLLKIFFEDGILGDEKKQKKYPAFKKYCKKFNNRQYELEDKGYEFIF